MNNKLKSRITFLCQLFVYSVFKFWHVWLIVIAIIVGALWLRSCREERARGEIVAPHVERTRHIAVTPEEVRHIKDIAEWEFLSVQTEELAELSRPRTLGDDRIVRVYTGTLRLGIDKGRVDDRWFEARGDTAVLHLPRITLLDQDFIRETSAEPFYCRGTWDAAAREKLYAQAKQKMLRRCLTKQNLTMARKNCTAQFNKIFFALGFRYVIINYSDPPTATR